MRFKYDVLSTSQSTPPSASPDCKLAHNCVNYRVVSARYRACVLCDAWAESLDISDSIAFTQTLIWRGWVLAIKKYFFTKLLH